MLDVQEYSADPHAIAGETPHLSLLKRCTYSLKVDFISCLPVLIRNLASSCISDMFPLRYYESSASFLHRHTKGDKTGF